MQSFTNVANQIMRILNYIIRLEVVVDQIKSNILNIVARMESFTSKVLEMTAFQILRKAIINRKI